MGMLKYIADKLYSNDVEVATVESGSNANGTYAKFGDGTLICNARITTPHPNATLIAGVYRSEGIITPFPYPFVGEVAGSGSIEDVSVQDSGWWCNVDGRSDNAGWRSRIYRNETFTSGNITYMHLTAIGRWK